MNEMKLGTWKDRENAALLVNKLIGSIMMKSGETWRYLDLIRVGFQLKMNQELLFLSTFLFVRFMLYYSDTLVCYANRSDSRSDLGNWKMLCIYMCVSREVTDKERIYRQTAGDGTLLIKIKYLWLLKW